MHRSRRLTFDLPVALLFILLVLFMTRPWIYHPLTTSIGFGDPAAGGLPKGDIMLSLTFGGWLRFAPAELHQWPLAFSKYLMYPHGVSPGTSFDGLLAGLVTALLWMVMPLLLAHNLTMLLGIFLCGFVCYYFARRTWGRGLTAVAVGLTALCMPYLWQRAGIHPNLLYIWTVPLGMHLFYNLERKPTWKRAAMWGGSFLLLAASSWYILIMGLAAQSCATLSALIRERFNWRSTLLRRVAGAWVLGVVMIVIVGWPMLTHFKGRAKIETSTLAKFSVPLAQFVMPFPGSAVGKMAWARAAQKSIGDDWEAYSGGPIAALLLLPVFLFARRGGKGLRLTLGLTAAAALFLALGPYLSVLRLQPPGQGLKLPLYWMGKARAAFNVVRIPGRMHPLLNFAAIFAAGALLEQWRRGVFAKRKPAWVALVCAFVALNLAWSVSMGGYPTFKNIEIPKFYSDLGGKPGSGAVMDVPITYYYFPHYNYYQFWHKRPAVTTVLYHDADILDARKFIWKDPTRIFFTDNNRDVVNKDLPARIERPEFMDDLSKAGVEYLVVHPKFIEKLSKAKAVHPDTLQIYKQVEQTWKSRLVYQDSWIHVYRTAPVN